MITLEGIVLKERAFGEQDKFIDILTKDRGLIKLLVRGARKINGKSSASTQLFAYSRFCINQKKDRFLLNSVEPIHIFYGLRNSLSAISLASYFADILKYSTAELTDSGNVLRLFLNTLFYLENGNRSEQLLKPIFELRLMSEIGFMPDILICRGCGCYEPEISYFSLKNGGFYCSECKDANEPDSSYFTIGLPVLTAVRHIVLADFDRLYNFRLSEKSTKVLSEFSEQYTLSHLGRNFNTLNFYKNLSSKTVE